MTGKEQNERERYISYSESEFQESNGEMLSIEG